MLHSAHRKTRKNQVGSARHNWRNLHFCLRSLGLVGLLLEAASKSERPVAFLLLFAGLAQLRQGTGLAENLAAVGPSSSRHQALQAGKQARQAGRISHILACPTQPPGHYLEEEAQSRIPFPANTRPAAFPFADLALSQPSQLRSITSRSPALSWSPNTAISGTPLAFSVTLRGSRVLIVALQLGRQSVYSV